LARPEKVNPLGSVRRIPVRAGTSPTLGNRKMLTISLPSAGGRLLGTPFRPRFCSVAPFPFLLLLSVLSLSGCGFGDEPLDPDRFPLIPVPADVDPGRGEFELTRETAIVVSPSQDAELTEMVERWAEPIREASGFPLPVVGPGEVSGRGSIQIELETPRSFGAAPLEAGEGIPAGMGLPGVVAEAYELEVSSGKVELEAQGKAGIFYGLGTLGQLVPGLRGEGPWSIPAVEIEDAPRFPYRGMHLDVARHYFPVSFIKRYIDLLATYKMNVFHWHLTEDQGWRLEILGYPRLAEVSSCRAETMLLKNFNPYVGDGIPYCGLYTQEEAREIVEYARERFITVIPEIELPGHSVAVLAAYPEFACTPGPFEVYTRWGVTRDIYCPREETFAFLEDVLTEVMDIFPSPYIHIGGDEAPKTAWERSPFAQEVIQREGLADEEELQSWFIRRIEAFLNANDRRLIGWDEILEGGLAPDATVMSWRGMAGGIEAAQEGHDVIMTPTSHLYFDFYQGDSLQEPLAIAGNTPLEKVYDFEPIPPQLDATQALHVLGAQANLWTEYILTTEYAEYMLLPRLLALSEVVWSPVALRDWDGFTRRLPGHLTRLAAEGINFRVPDVLGLERDRFALGDSAVVHLSAPVSGGEIHYTLDGSEPGATSSRYEGGFSVAVGENAVEVSARVIMGDGRLGAIRTARFSQTDLLPPVSVPLSGRARGLALEAASERPALVGFIRVPRTGMYTFFMPSGGGGRLVVGDRILIDPAERWPTSEAAGQVALRRGWYPIEIQGRGSGEELLLQLQVEGPEAARRRVPATWLAHVTTPTMPMTGDLSP